MAIAQPVATVTAAPTAPRARGAVVSFDVAARRVRAARLSLVGSGNTAGEGGSPGSPQGGRDTARRPLVRALLLSLAVHGLAVAAMGVFVGIGGSGREAPFTDSHLVATLAGPTKSPAPVAAPAAAPAPIAPAAQAESAAPLTVPLKPKQRAVAFKGSPEGMATINPIPPDHAAGPSVAAHIAQFHPEAVRGALEFEVPPRGIYPQAAVEQRLQIDFVVPVVVLEDGRVEVANGSFDDPLFGPAIRAGLRDARARPAVNAAGRTVPLWGLLSFAFEYIGGRPEAK